MTSILPTAQIRPSAQLSSESAAVLNNTASKVSAQTEKAARQAAEEFEAVFLDTMLQGMFAGIKSEAPFGGGYGEQVFRSMMVNEYAKDLSAAGGIGIADQVYREILAQQERRNQ